MITTIFMSFPPETLPAACAAPSDDPTEEPLIADRPHPLRKMVMAPMPVNFKNSLRFISATLPSLFDTPILPASRHNVKCLYLSLRYTIFLSDACQKAPAPKIEADAFESNAYRKRRKTPPFRAGDIRRVRRICVSN